jgi:hypothetical protein
MSALLRRTFTAATVAATAAAGTVVLAMLAGPASADQTPMQRGPGTVRHETHHDTSPPLSRLAPVPPNADPGEADPVHRMPNRGKGNRSDPVVQRRAGSGVAATLANFDGLGQGFTGPGGPFPAHQAVPPDPNAAVGATQIVELVNTGFAVFDKGGTPLYGPAATNTLFAGFGGKCQTTNDGDAVVRYDALAGRWIVTQFANVSGGGPYFECIAISKTSDATGAWNRYSFQYASFPDYPKLSVWPDAYYVTYNLFNASGTAFLGAEICAMDRAAMLAGTTATQQCHTTSTSYGGLLAADFEGGTPPPAGKPNTVLALGTTSTTLAAWVSHVDWANPNNSTFAGPSNVTVAAYTAACGASGTCVPQKGVSQQLDSLSDRLMFRLAYRNLGDHESLVTNHAVTVGSSVGVRWYELRLSSTGMPSVFQQGTYAPDSTYRWMGSIAMDKAGNIGLGYSASSSSLNPQIRYTGRLAGDPTGQLTQTENTIIAGGGSQTTYSRWGDYSSMVVDPTDGCTFWYTQEYEATTGTRNWHTRLASFSLPGCAGGGGGNDFSIGVSPPAASVTAGDSATATVSTAVVSGSAQTVALSAGGLPTGATASFNPATVTAGAASTLTIATSASTPPGTYPVTVTGSGPSGNHSASFTLTIAGPGGGGITNGGFEADLSGWTTTGSTATVTSPVHGGAKAARAGSTSPTGDSTLAQTFTATGTTLNLWYRMVCPDTVRYDWFTVTLKDNTTGTTTTPLGKTCASPASYQQLTAALTAGHSYTVTLTNHDDNYPGDASYTYIDDVALS